MHGHGVFTFASGIYCGEMHSDKFHGVGHFTAGPTDYVKDGRVKWAANSVYDGHFENMQRSRHGTLTWPNGEVFEGQWLEGWRNGQGVLRGSDGTVLQEGEWKDDVFVGAGL